LFHAHIKDVNVITIELARITIHCKQRARGIRTGKCAASLTWTQSTHTNKNGGKIQTCL